MPPTETTPSDFDRDAYLTVTEVAKIFNRTPRPIQSQCQKGIIPGVILVEGGPFRPYYLIPKTSLPFVCSRPVGRPRRQPFFPGTAPQIAYRDAKRAQTAPQKGLDESEKSKPE
jgi:hypothetical protein